MEIEIGGITIEEEVEIGGIEMDIQKVYPELENLEITPRAFKQTFNHPESYGYDEITVEAMEVKLEERAVIPSEEAQIIVPSEKNDGFRRLIVEEIPENLKKEDLDEELTEQDKLLLNQDEVIDKINKTLKNKWITNSPSGTLEITENGEYDVSMYAKVIVNIPYSVPSEYRNIATADGKTLVTVDNKIFKVKGA